LTFSLHFLSSLTFSLVFLFKQAALKWRLTSCISNIHLELTHKWITCIKCSMQLFSSKKKEKMCSMQLYIYLFNNNKVNGSLFNFYQPNKFIS
jgi:hypothetical protein